MVRRRGRPAVGAVPLRVVAACRTAASRATQVSPRKRAADPRLAEPGHAGQPGIRRPASAARLPAHPVGLRAIAGSSHRFPIRRERIAEGIRHEVPCDGSSAHLLAGAAHVAEPTGRPACSASMEASGQPSEDESRTKPWAAASSRGRGARWSRRWMRSRQGFLQLRPPFLFSRIGAVFPLQFSLRSLSSRSPPTPQILRQLRRSSPPKMRSSAPVLRAAECSPVNGVQTPHTRPTIDMRLLRQILQFRSPARVLPKRLNEAAHRILRCQSIFSFSF